MDIQITKNVNEEIICNEKEQVVKITTINEDGDEIVSTKTLELKDILELFISQQKEIKELKKQLEK